MRLTIFPASYDLAVDVLLKTLDVDDLKVLILSTRSFCCSIISLRLLTEGLNVQSLNYSIKTYLFLIEGTLTSPLLKSIKCSEINNSSFNNSLIWSGSSEMYSVFSCKKSTSPSVIIPFVCYCSIYMFLICVIKLVISSTY